MGLGRISLLSAILLAFYLRALPTIYTGHPYYVDSWPLIAGARTFTSVEEARILDDRFYDGYNNRWPYSIISTGILSLILGVSVEDVGRLLGPMLGTAALIAFYALASRIASGNAGLASLLVATAGTLFAFEGGLTKEVYARPLVLLYILVACYTWNPLGALILSHGVIMSHHVSTIALLGIISGIMVVNIVYDVARGFNVLDFKRLLIALILPTIMLALHSTLIARTFWDSVVELERLAMISLYLVTAYSIAFNTLMPSQRVTRAHRLLFASTIGLSALAMSLIAMRAPPTPQTQPLGLYMILYATPLLLSPLAAYTKRASRDQAVIAGGWLVGLGALMAYSAFSGDPVAGAAIHRFINYTFYAVSLGYALGLRRILLAQALIALATSPLVAAGIVLERDPYFHFNTYKDSDVIQARMITLSDKGVYGDSKVSYIAYMYNVTVEYPPLRLDKLEKPLVIHRENLAKGFWVGGLIYGNPNVISETIRAHSTIYNSGTNIIALS